MMETRTDDGFIHMEVWRMFSRLELGDSRERKVLSDWSSMALRILISQLASWKKFKHDHDQGCHKSVNKELRKNAIYTQAVPNSRIKGLVNSHQYHGVVIRKFNFYFQGKKSVFCFLDFGTFKASI